MQLKQLSSVLAWAFQIFKEKGWIEISTHIGLSGRLTRKVPLKIRSQQIWMIRTEVFLREEVWINRLEFRSLRMRVLLRILDSWPTREVILLIRLSVKLGAIIVHLIITLRVSVSVVETSWSYLKRIFAKERSSSLKVLIASNLGRNLWSGRFHTTFCARNCSWNWGLAGGRSTLMVRTHHFNWLSLRVAVIKVKRFLNAL